MARGFLLPDVIDPPDDICIAVHIPNDPKYIEAFFGAYQQLSYWYSWQRDPEKRGRLAGLRWRQSVEETWTTYQTYGDLCTMQITVNCGCCETGVPLTYAPNPDVGQIPPDQAGEIIVLPTDLVDDGITPPTLSFPDYPSYLAWKCETATRLADDILNTFERLGGLGIIYATAGVAGWGMLLSGTGIATAFVGLLATFLTPIGAVAVVVSLFTGALLAGYRALRYFGKLRDEVDRDELICLFYTAQSPIEARALFMQRLAEKYPDIAFEGGDAPIFQGLIEDLLDYVAPDELFSVLFEAISGYQTGGTFDCSQCVSQVEVTMVQGTWNQEYFTSTNGPSNNDTNSYGNLDVYLGGFVAIGQETTPPHATVNNLVLDNWSPNWQLANNIHIYRPALLGGVINVNSIEALTFPIENVYRIYITARKANPADGQVENNAVFTLTPTFE